MFSLPVAGSRSTQLTSFAVATQFIIAMPSFHSTGALIPISMFDTAAGRPCVRIVSTSEREGGASNSRRNGAISAATSAFDAARRTAPRNEAPLRHRHRTTPSVSASGEYDAEHVIERLHAIHQRHPPGTRELDVDDVSLRRRDHDARHHRLALELPDVARDDLHRARQRTTR